MLITWKSAASYNFTTVPLTDREQQPFELILSDLRRAAKYAIVIRAFNRYGEGPLSPASSVSTLEDGNRNLFIYWFLVGKMF